MEEKLQKKGRRELTSVYEGPAGKKFGGEHGPELGKSGKGAGGLQGKEASGQKKSRRGDLFGASTEETCPRGQEIGIGGSDFVRQELTKAKRAIRHAVYSIDTIYSASIFLLVQPESGILKAMGYPVKIQKVERPTNRSFYVNFPAVLADAIGIQKGEDFEWWVED